MIMQSICFTWSVRAILTSDDHISGNRHAVHLGLNGTRIFPSMPQLNGPYHDVTGRALSVHKLEKQDDKKRQEKQ